MADITPDPDGKALRDPGRGPRSAAMRWFSSPIVTEGSTRLFTSEEARP
jgi:hypothetical protein